MPDNTSLQSSTKNSLANVQKRLSLIYPQKHELKISYEREMLIVLLKIQLVNTPLTETEEDVKSLVTEQAIDQPNPYA
ncbi:MAG: hypothetical protein H0U39_10315 [Segetibacter sp.]|nr:hypothetical protein [Segetibacter sp.]